ncbi:MAG: RnfABCDGE type electron transport complex subunit D [Defluviitaleaceae bacterium]|nr:RnfABCDGE type electron transport complex subunit D [Defluviitaleaceae bacterium]
MRFAYKPSPHIKARVSTKDILNTVLIALIFVTAWSLVAQFINFGTDYVLRSALIIAVACVVAILTNVVFYLVKTDGQKFSSFVERLKSTVPKTKKGAPLITALILALSLPVGTPIYAVIIATIFAEFFAKLLFGGFGGNVFNPAAVGLVVGGITFGSQVILPDVYAGATPLATISGLYGWRLTDATGLGFIAGYGGFIPMLFGAVRGSIGDPARVAVLIALVFMIYKRVLDWVVPAVYIATVVAITGLFSLYLGVGIWYPTLHVLSGGLLFGAVFMATDPVTTPVNRQGRILFAIFLAMVTLVIRFNSSHTESMAFSILIMNMFVPLIDRKTANITKESTTMKAVGVCIAFVIAISVTLGLTITLG